MTQRFDMLIRGGSCVLPDGVARADIGIDAGCIEAIGDLSGAEGGEVFDASALHVLPGIIDTQVHFREPGMEHKEDLATGTAAAVLGGVTAVFEMPNTRPPTVDAVSLKDKLARAAGRAWCDHAFFVGATPENADTLAILERRPGCAGVKMFMGSSTGGLLVEDDAAVARVLASGSRRVAVHSEDEARLRERRDLIRDGGTAHLHPVWRDEETALKSTRRLIRLAEAAARPVHVLHVTTAEEMAFLRDHRAIASVEVTPQHLTLAAPDCYDRLGSLAQMNPPIRDARHRQALWQALADGIVDVIGSDHAPHTREEKARDYPQSPSGMPGVQTTVPVMLDHVHRGRLSLERMVELLCHTPARLFGIAGKGGMVVGNDGDLTLVDLAAERRISNADMASRTGWTPFDGMTVRGWPVATVIRGRLVMRDGELQGNPQGAPVRFMETPAAVA